MLKTFTFILVNKINPFIKVPFQTFTNYPAIKNFKLRLSSLPLNTVRKHSGDTVTMSQREEWIIIGIAGVTCGGKTTLANRLLKALHPVWVFHQDEYFLPDDSPLHVAAPGLAHNNYDLLSAVDNARLLADMRRTLRGEGAGAGGGGALTIPGKKFLVVEGFTTLNYKPIMELCDLRYYFELEFGECLARRVLRVYEPPDVPGYFEACVWPEHLKYKAEISRDPRVRFLYGGDPDVLRLVMDDIAALANKPHN